MKENIEIKFKDIIAHGGSQTNAFEELCTQLARNTISNTDKFDRFHGDGGDGGVECISTDINGNVTGWQSKFVFTVDSLIVQVKKSLSAAISNYPNLKKFIICFPFDYTGVTGRKNKEGDPAKSGKNKLEEWRKGVLERSKINGDFLDEIVFWPASELTSLLVQYDVSGGIRTYFFSDIFMSKSWFKNNLESAINRAGPRYSKELNIETDLGKSYAAFGRTLEWENELQILWNRISVPFESFKKHINKKIDSVFPGLDAKFNDKATAIVDRIAKFKEQFFYIAKLNLDQNVGNAQVLENFLTEAIGSLSEIETEIVSDLNSVYPNENWDTKQWRTFMLEYNVSSPTNALDNVRNLIEKLQEAEAFFNSINYKLFTSKIFLLSGVGGSGKTHSICDISKSRIDNGELSLIISGDQFGGSPNEWSRFAEIIGLNGYNKDKILDALNASALQSRKPLIIFLDAINETNPRSYWIDRIVSFSEEIAKRPFLKLCISCRSSFINASLPEHYSFLTLEHQGFKGLERDACNSFFRYYELNPPLLPILHPEMGNPLYLRLLCSTLKSKGLNDLPIGWFGIRPVINGFLLEKDKQLCIQYEIPRNLSIVPRALTSVVKEIVAKGQTSLNWSTAINAISQNNPPLDPHKLLEWLIKSDLLIEDGAYLEDEFVSETLVRPAFERLGDFLLALELGKVIMANSNSEIKDLNPLFELTKTEELINENYGLIQALSVVLPELYNIELPSLFVSDSNYPLVCCISTEALIWRSPETLGDSTEVFVKKSLSNDGFVAMDSLLSICTLPSNVDSLWLHKIFSQTELGSRDAFLSQYFLFSFEQNQIVKNLTKVQVEIDFSIIDIDVAKRWLIVLIWMNASPDRRIKDSALRLAVLIIKNFQTLSRDLFELFSKIDDDEVFERFLLVLYGSFILSPNIIELTFICDNLIEEYTSNSSIFNNALIRDHSRCLIELRNHLGGIESNYDPFLFTNKQPTENWDLSIPGPDERKEWSEIRGAIGLANRSCFFDDFNHYSINCLKGWMSNHSKEDFAAWIMRDLTERKGLDNYLHSDYDIEILRSSGGGRGKPTYAERIGKKYQWNSMYRLASILHDNVTKTERPYDPPNLIEGLILQEERKIDPTLMQPYFKSDSPNKNWWFLNGKKLQFSQSESLEEWFKSNTSIPTLNDIVQKVIFENQTWLPLSIYFSMTDSNDETINSDPYKLLTFSVKSFVVNTVDVERIKKKLNKSKMHEVVPGDGNYSYTYLGEYPWATSNNTEPDWYLNVGETFANTDIPAFNTMNTIVCEWEYDASLKKNNLYIPVPHKRFFNGKDLMWNGIDGFKNHQNKTVFKDPRFSTGGEVGFVADIDDLIVRLSEMKSTVFWILNGDKHIMNGLDRFNAVKYFSQYCWIDDKGELQFSEPFYFDSY